MSALPKEIEAGATLAVSRIWGTHVPQSVTVTYSDDETTTFTLARPSLGDVYTMAKAIVMDCAAADAQHGEPLLCQITTVDASTLRVRIMRTDQV